jgi:hypothetical protein
MTTGTTGGTYISPIRAVSSAANVYFNPVTNEMCYNSSTIQDKTDVKNLENDTSTIYNLNPRIYTYIPDGRTNCVGFIAQEVDQVDTAFSVKNIYDEPENINWDALTTYLVSEIKKLNNRITQLENTITVMTNTNTNTNI